MPDPAPVVNAPVTPAPVVNQPAPFVGKHKDADTAASATGELFVKLGLGKEEDFKGKPTNEIIGRIYSHYESELGKRSAAEKAKDGKPATDGKPTADAPIVALPKDDAPKPNEPASFKFDETTSFEKIVETSGLKLDEIQKTLREKGTLDDAQVKAIADATHLPKALIKRNAEGELAIQQLRDIKVAQAKSNATTLFGGEEQMVNVLKWAKSHYPADQHDAINTDLNNLDSYENRIKSILFDYGQHSGTSGSRPLVNGGGSSGAAGAGWTDHQKMIAEMDAFKARTGKEWHTDPGMRARMEKTPDHVKKGRKA